MNDSRISHGLERQLRERGDLISAGRSPLGWKAGFGAAGAQQRFGLNGPLSGFMTDASVIADGGEADISTWAHAVAEPELAVYLGSDLPANSGEAATRAAISGVGPAIELANIDPPPQDVEEILAGNIYHKAVILGAPDTTYQGADLSGLEARVGVGGEERFRTTRLEDLTGRLVDVVSHMATMLADHGESMRAGEVVICGSVVPPIDITPGAVVTFELHPMTPISVSVR